MIVAAGLLALAGLLVLAGLLALAGFLLKKLNNVPCLRFLLAEGVFLEDGDMVQRQFIGL